MSDPASVSISQLDDCGCCAGVQKDTPAAVANRPGLPAIAYRIGTHRQFKASMLAGLSDSARPALLGLRSRDDDDFSIALLDAVATMADVLSFYQERIANESYLRTATERRSVLELARLIGYELRPGVASAGYLAFTVDETASGPAKVPITVGAKVQSIPLPGQKPQTFETVEAIEARPEWNALPVQRTQPQPIWIGQQALYLDGTNTGLVPGDAILLVGNERSGNNSTSPDKERWDFRILTSVTPKPEIKATLVAWEKGLGTHSITPAQDHVECYAMKQRAHLFGYNAPDWLAMPSTMRLAYVYQAGISGQYNRRDPSTWGTEWPNLTNDRVADSQIDLDMAYPKIVPQNWIVLRQPGYTELYRVSAAEAEARSKFAISSASTRLTLDTNENLVMFGVRETEVFAQSETKTIALIPGDPLTGGEISLENPADPALVGRWLAVSGFDATSVANSELDATKWEAISEVVRVTGVSGNSIAIAPGLKRQYAIATVSLNANVAPATHGETVQEVLGNGDATAAFQRFILKQPPLTYVPSTDPTGATSTLEVRVNDLLWHEVPTLYGRGAKERVFVTRRDDAGNTTVQFGDGKTGARLPSGQLNLRARYRKGIGIEGMQEAGQLSMLLTRPLGVKGVVNPLATDAAKDADTLDLARRNAPKNVLTLGRAVSLEDFEDFARGFGPVAKALANWAWDGKGRCVLVTVAGPPDAPLSDGNIAELVAALQRASDPFVRMRVVPYRSRQFYFGCGVKVDADYEANRVLAAVGQKLRAAFSFDGRDLGQPVYLSEIIDAVHSVPGVVAVSPTTLHAFPWRAGLQERILGLRPALLPSGLLTGVELLTLDPGPLHLETMS